MIEDHCRGSYAKGIAQLTHEKVTSWIHHSDQQAPRSRWLMLAAPSNTGASEKP